MESLLLLEKVIIMNQLEITYLHSLLMAKQQTSC